VVHKIGSGRLQDHSLCNVCGGDTTTGSLPIEPHRFLSLHTLPIHTHVSDSHVSDTQVIRHATHTHTHYRHTRIRHTLPAHLPNSHTHCTDTHVRHTSVAPVSLRSEREQRVPTHPYTQSPTDAVHVHKGEGTASPNSPYPPSLSQRVS
jgi:hypothetical protein